ncbi:DNA/RNA non-specific endonuclease [Aestuariibius insulae]|uniref:DNA/RNA non-specific endonuclease n=1 Tax=Aestuariibius insulae TaxID=2058287 RepID=UPI00345E11F1
MPYDPDFIAGQTLPLPLPSDAVLSAAYEQRFIDHSRMSLLFNQKRGLAACTAHNIDGAALQPAQQTERDYRFDPKIEPASLQIDTDRGYRNNPWDRGHLVRRKSVSWGDPEQAARAELESDYYSNITPQHETLHSASWGRIEDWMLARVDSGEQRACIFTGPVFTEADPQIVNAEGEEPIRIPAGFWKIIAVEADGIMRAAGFLTWQRDYDDPNPLPFEPQLEQVRLTTIEVLTGLAFPALRLFDPLLYGSDQAPLTRRSLRGSDDLIVSLGDDIPVPAPRRTSSINAPRDIIL